MKNTDSADVIEDATTWLMVSERRALPKWLLDEVRKQVYLRFPVLSPDRDLTARQILGPEMWETFTRSLASMAGEALGYLVATGAVPLVRVGTNRANHRIYRLR